MKTVYPSKEVMHIWANQNQDHARNSSNNVYFRGDTIYSYGSHFPMARHYNNIVFVTKQGYSNTTRKHLSFLRRAIWQEEVHCTYIPQGSMDECIDTHIKNYKDWTGDIQESLKKLIRARKKQIHIDNIVELRREAERYSEVTGIPIPAEMAAKMYAESMEQYMKADEAEVAAIAVRREAERVRTGELMVVYNDAWHNRMDTDWIKTLAPYDQALLRAAVRATDGATWLRIEGEEIATSLDINIPIPVAERYYRHYLAVVANGGCGGESGCGEYKMVGYTVHTMNEKILIVGCHRIPRTEIDYIANKLNWVK